MGDLRQLGLLFQFAGLSVVGMLAGLAGLHLRMRLRYGRLGRIGVMVSGLGYVLLLPGSLMPSQRIPAPFVAGVPLLFFVGLVLLAVGSAIVGHAAYHDAELPFTLTAAYAAAMPLGFIGGGLLALTGSGNIALVLGLMAPFGLAWLALGSFLAVAP